MMDKKYNCKTKEIRPPKKFIKYNSDNKINKAYFNREKIVINCEGLICSGIYWKT